MFSWLYERFFDHDDPVKVRRWRIFVSQVLIILCGYAAFTMSAMTAGVPKAGELVWSKDVQDKVQQASQPIKEQLEEVKAAQASTDKKVDLLTESVNLQLAQSKAAEIRLLTYKRCKAQTFSDRDRLNGEIYEAQREYKKLTGEVYLPPGCSEL